MSFKNQVKKKLADYYYEHHDQDRLEEELISALEFARVAAFSETKHKILESIDFRLETLRDTRDLFEAYELRANELETVRKYIKGLVISRDEKNKQ